MADAQRIVIYTPQEDFWYNGPGAPLAIWGIGFIICAIAGYAISSIICRRYWWIQEGPRYHAIAIAISLLAFAGYYKLIIP